MKNELTQEQMDFKLDVFTLNNQFIYWLTKAKCMWDLKTTNEKYDELRLKFDHGNAFENLKRKMFQEGLKD